MWPMLLDYTHDECKRILRKLELEAYASVISAFRAQGELSKEKKKMLQDISAALSISLERHRAEVRRAVNDERLHTIADRLSGPNTGTEWAIEGRRLVPLMPRLVPQTAFTAIANSAANAQAAKNAAMPIPSATGLKENGENEDAENERYGRKRPSSAEPASTPQKVITLERTSPGPFAPSSCVFTSAISNKESESLTSPMIPSTVTTSPCLPVVTRTVTLPVGPNPLKITLTTTSHRPTSTMSISAASKQVILMSNSNTSISPSILQRPMSVPVVKTVSTTASANTSYQGKPLVSTSGVPALSTVSHNTVPASASSEMNLVTPSSILPSGPPYLSSAGGFTQTISTSTAPMCSTQLPRARPKVSAVSRLPLRPRSSTNSIVTPPQMMNQQCLSPQLPNPSSLQSASRVHSPISKSRSPASRTPSPASVCHLPRSQSPAAGQNISRAQSPASSTPNAPLSTNNPPRSQSPISASGSPSPVSVQVPLKAAVSPKSLNKGCLHKPQSASGARTLLPTASKAPLKNIPSAVTSAPCQSHPSIQTSIRTSAPTQATLPIRMSTPLIQTQKGIHGSGHVQVKSTGAPPRTIQYRNEGGLKIITQNFGNSRILPKPQTASSTQGHTSVSNKLSAGTTGSSGVPTNARLINIQPPINSRVAHAINSSSVSSLGLPGLSNTALRVTLPAGTIGTQAVVKSNTLGAKPNVIVVHKAQVWSQSQGATIVVSSSGGINRISPEAVEAVSLIQRQERGRQPGTVTVVKSVPVSHNSTVIPNTNTAPASAIAGSSSDVISSNIIQSDNLAERCNSSTQEQEKPSETDSKNTILADLIQLAGIIPENSTPLIVEELPTDEIIPPEKTIELAENTLDSETPEVGTNDPISDTNKHIINLDEKTSSVSNLSAAKADLESAEQLSKVKFLSDKVEKSDSKDWSQQSTVEIKNPTKEEKVCVLGSIEDSTSINIQDINLDQLPEGQILELQAQDAAELLSQHGQLSNEVLELLQQAGLQVEVQEGESNTASIQIPDSSVNTEELPQSHCNQNKKLETELDPQTGVLYVAEDIKGETQESDPNTKNEPIESPKPEDQSVSDIFSTALATAQLDLNSLQFVEDVMTGNSSVASSTSNNENNTGLVSALNFNPHGTTETDNGDGLMCSIKVSGGGGSDITSPMLSSVNQKQADEDILLVPIDNTSLEEQNSDKISQQNTEKDMTRPGTMETMHDEHALALPPGALVVNNITVELAGLDTSNMKLEDFTSQRVEGSSKDSADYALEESFCSTPTATLCETKGNESFTKTKKCVSAPAKKRKAFYHDAIASAHFGGWLRAASSLLDRTMKLKKDGKLLPSHWITSQETSKGGLPTNLERIDFSTVRTKIECHSYITLGEFHEDMKTVERLCQKHGAFNHSFVECADVFAFYHQEYNRIVDKYHK